MSAPKPTSPLHDVHVHASPVDAPWLDDPAMTFWQPTFGERAKLMGPKQWLTLAAVPVAIVLVLGAIVGTFWSHQFNYGTFLMLKGGFKLVLIAGAFFATGGLKLAKKALAGKSDPFCIRCGYSLIGLPDGHRCPECGLPISHAIIAEYRRDPEHFVARWRSRHRLVTPGGITPLEVPPNARRRKSRDGT